MTVDTFSLLLSASAVLLFLLLLFLGIRQARQGARLKAAEEALEKARHQITLLQESGHAMGRQLVEQQRALQELAGRAIDTAGQQAAESDIQLILQRLDSGMSVQQVAEDTGLDEVEITLLQEIRASREPEPQL